MGNFPSSISTEPLGHRHHHHHHHHRRHNLHHNATHSNMSTVSLPPTIRGSRNHIDDAERKEIFPISDKGAPALPVGRRGSIGFFRGKRAMAPASISPTSSAHLLQNLDLTYAHWHPPPRVQQHQHQTSETSTPTTAYPSPWATTPTTAFTTPATTVITTPTTPACPTMAPPLSPHCSQPTSPVAASIQDHHPQQEKKLALFMKRNLLPPHALLTTTTTNSSTSTLAPLLSQSGSTTAPPSLVTTVGDVAATAVCNCQQSYGHCVVAEQCHQQSPLSSSISNPMALMPPVDVIPSGLDIPNLPVADWNNHGRWEGEQEWGDDIPEGLEHQDSEAWSQLDSYSIEQHITRTLCKGQNYSAPLDFLKRPSPAHFAEGLPVKVDQTQARPIHVQYTPQQTLYPTQEYRLNGESEHEHAHQQQQRDEDRLSSVTATESTAPIPASSTPSRSLDSMSTLGSQHPLSTTTPCKEEERSLVILSVGCGNTQWATEMARAHPHSAVHAINVSQIPSLSTIPEKTPSFDLDNLFFYNLDDNSLRIPFASNSVDYIHIRRFLPVISKAKYFCFLRELVRVLKVDGYIELVELDQRMRDTGVASSWPSNWTLIGFDKLGIDASLAMNLSGILKIMPGIEPLHRSSINIPIGMYGGRVGLAMELLSWRWAKAIRPWLMRQAMLSGAEFDDLLERARAEVRTLKSYQICYIAVGRKIANV